MTLIIQWEIKNEELKEEKKGEKKEEIHYDI